jgi:Fic family protein
LQVTNSVDGNQDIFSYLPVESLIYTHQDDYYLALQQSTKQANSAPFIEFILQMILDSCKNGVLMIIHIYVKVSHN